MFKASSSHFPLAAVLLLLAGTSMTAQGTSPLQTKLPLKAALVLTPDFCTSRVTHGVPKDPKVGIEAGKVACVDFEPALKDVFTTLSTISSPKDAGDAQIILTPRFVDAGVTTGLTAFSNSELNPIFGMDRQRRPRQNNLARNRTRICKAPPRDPIHIQEEREVDHRLCRAGCGGAISAEDVIFGGVA